MATTLSLVLVLAMLIQWMRRNRLECSYCGGWIDHEPHCPRNHPDL